MELQDVLVRVIPFAVLGALSPFNISIVILMLLSPDHPIARALAFIGGFVASLLVIGMLTVSFFVNVYVPPLRPGAYVLITTLGAVLIVVGIRQLLTQTDLDEPPSAWMKKISQFRPLTAFVVGLLMSMLGLKTLAIYVSCLSIIMTANLGFVTQLNTVILVTFIMIVTMLIPVVIFLIEPQRGKEILQRMREWMIKRQHKIAGTVLVIVGAAIVLAGIQELI